MVTLGTLSRNRKALTRTEASTTALGGIGPALMLYDAEDFGFQRSATIAVMTTLSTRRRR